MKEEEEEIIALAEQLNSRLEKTHDSVDLDNLFAFLTDVQTGRNHIIDHIGEKMKELVTDIDMEVSKKKLEKFSSEHIPQVIMSHFSWKTCCSKKSKP